MVFARVLSQAGNTYPLPRLVVKRDWPPEVNPHYLRGQELCPDNRNLDLVARQADELVERKDDTGPKEEVPEKWILHQTAGSMEKHENVENIVPVMGEPEGLEPVTPGVLCGKDENHYSNHRQ